MKKLFFFLAFALFCCLNVFSQATSLTIDCQNPGWLSSMINDDDQQILENIKVTGYINGTDIKFIREMNLNRSLSGVIDLEEANIVAGGESYGTFNSDYSASPVSPITKENTITDYMFANLKALTKVVLPKSTTVFSGLCQFYNTQVDTIIINGSMTSIIVGKGYNNVF